MYNTYGNIHCQCVACMPSPVSCGCLCCTCTWFNAAGPQVAAENGSRKPNRRRRDVSVCGRADRWWGHEHLQGVCTRGLTQCPIKCALSIVNNTIKPERERDTHTHIHTHTHTQHSTDSAAPWACRRLLTDSAQNPHHTLVTELD